MNESIDEMINELFNHPYYTKKELIITCLNASFKLVRFKTMMDIILGSVLCIYKSTVISIKNRKNKMDRDIVRGRAIKKMLSVGNKKLCLKCFG